MVVTYSEDTRSSYLVTFLAGNKDELPHSQTTSRIIYADSYKQAIYLAGELLDDECLKILEIMEIK
jgi:hypothetical protein